MELVAGIARPRCRLAVAVTGSTILSIAVVRPIEIGPLPIVLAGRRAVTHSPTAKTEPGNSSVARAVIWLAIGQAVGMGSVTGPAAQAWETDLALIASAAGTFPAVVAATGMLSEEVHAATTVPMRGRVAVVARPVWDPGVEASVAVAAVSVAAVVGGAGN